MTTTSQTIWCNAHFSESAMAQLRQGLGGHTLLIATDLKSNLAGGGADPLLDQADIALGQPNVNQMISLQRLRWVHLTSAGYTRYDRDDVKSALRARGAALTNSSAVYSEPCAEHAFAMMMSLARQLPQCWAEQAGNRAWSSKDHRIHSRLLRGQNVLLLGYGSIGKRLAAMLGPMEMRITAIRRQSASEGAVRIASVEQVDSLLPEADHVVNVLPANPSTEHFLSAARIGLLKPTAIVYNIGRGTTVDQDALLAALQQKRIAAAYLDVTEPEPLPKDHPLYSAPNCFITPHTAGGHDREFESLVQHFLDNLRRFEAGQALVDRVV